MSRIAVDSIGLDIYPAIDWAEWRLIRLGVEAKEDRRKQQLKKNSAESLDKLVGTYIEIVIQITLMKLPNYSK